MGNGKLPFDTRLSYLFSSIRVLYHNHFFLVQPMIVTGPLSMNLYSELAEELSNGETNGIGMRVVDVGERGEFTHKWLLLDEKEQFIQRSTVALQRSNDSYKAPQRRMRQSVV